MQPFTEQVDRNISSSNSKISPNGSHKNASLREAKKLQILVAQAPKAGETERFQTNLKTETFTTVSSQENTSLRYNDGGTRWSLLRVQSLAFDERGLQIAAGINPHAAAGLVFRPDGSNTFSPIDSTRRAVLTTAPV